LSRLIRVTSFTLCWSWQSSQFYSEYFAEKGFKPIKYDAMEATIKIPFYAKAALIFISGFALTFTLYIGQDIIVPIIYATIVAILLNPLVSYLTRVKVN
jgi:hypothetical protein